MNYLEFHKVYYLPIGRVFVLKTSDGYLIETTEMRTVNASGLMLEDIKQCWEEIVDYKDKWIMDISTQKGCPYKCLFCDVPKNRFKGNLTKDEIIEQISFNLKSTPYVTQSKSLSIYFARMGEPSHNIHNILLAIDELDNVIPDAIHYTPAINTILPQKVNSYTGYDILKLLIDKKNERKGNMDINISCSTTDDNYRNHLLKGAKVYPIRDIIKEINKYNIFGNRIRLNFIIMKDIKLNTDIFNGLDMSKIELRLTPLTNTENSKSNNINNDDIHLQELEKELKSKNIKYHILPTPHMKTFGLGCGQFISLNTRS